MMYRYRCTNIDPDLIGGFFMLTSKTAWLKAGKFRGTGLLGEDNEYHRRVMAAGMKTYRIDGIYALHLRERGEPTWIPGVKTTVEFWREYKKRHEKNRLHGNNG
jgi:GT2 family glycosyltransferase